jgi:hypothetical protein
MNINEKDDKIIAEAAEKISVLLKISHIILISAKHSVQGDMTGFKLCVVHSDSLVKADIETAILLEIDSPVPFDVVCYTESEWEKYSADPTAFAGKVAREGRRYL